MSLFKVRNLSELIFSYQDTVTFAALPRVCKLWHRILSQNKKLKQQICIKEAHFNQSFLVPQMRNFYPFLIWRMEILSIPSSEKVAFLVADEDCWLGLIQMGKLTSLSLKPNQQNIEVLFMGLYLYVFNWGKPKQLHIYKYEFQNHSGICFRIQDYGIPFPIETLYQAHIDAQHYLYLRHDEKLSCLKDSRVIWQRDYFTFTDLRYVRLTSNSKKMVLLQRDSNHENEELFLLDASTGIKNQVYRCLKTKSGRIVTQIEALCMSESHIFIAWKLGVEAFDLSLRHCFTVWRKSNLSMIKCMIFKAQPDFLYIGQNERILRFRLY